MSYYSSERKAALLKKLLPPISLSVPTLARQEGVSRWTLYTWRKQAKTGGAIVPGNKKSDAWSAEVKFAVVMETAALSELELSAYCRSKGLYPEQVNTWRQACVAGQQADPEQRLAERTDMREARKRIKELERELRRKDKALAEMAALMVLRKKLDAYWSDDNEDA